MKNKDKHYPGLAQSQERFKVDLSDEKTSLLFNIAYKLGYDKALEDK